MKSKSPEPTGNSLLLRPSEVCKLLNVGRSTVYEMITRGDLPAVHIGRLVRVPRLALDEWIEANTTKRDWD